MLTDDWDIRWAAKRYRRQRSRMLAAMARRQILLRWEIAIHSHAETHHWPLCRLQYVLALLRLARRAVSQWEFELQCVRLIRRLKTMAHPEGGTV